MALGGRLRPQGVLAVACRHNTRRHARLARRSCSQALKTFGNDVAIAFSGAEDVALIEYAHLTGRPYRVFRCVCVFAAGIPRYPPQPCHSRPCSRRSSSLTETRPSRLPCAPSRRPPTHMPLCTPNPHCSLDTGRLNAETYQLFDAVEKHYKIRIEYTFPEAQEVMDLVRAKGLYSFYEDGHTECCRIRKVWWRPRGAGGAGPGGGCSSSRLGAGASAWAVPRRRDAVVLLPSASSMYRM